MKKIIIIPDSFKGSMSTIEVTNIMEYAVRQKFPQAHIIGIPISDGGEGSIDAFSHFIHGKKVKITVSDPYFQPIEANYLISNKQAIIEMAQCAGISIVESRLDPTKTTTFGVGEMIRDAIRKGVNQITLCVGGSATNDAGSGMLSALGIKFLDDKGIEFIPTGGTLHKIHEIDDKGLINSDDISFTIISDVENVLYGLNGAAYIYGPQKGANESTVHQLDLGLRHFAEIVRLKYGINLQTIKGGGAGGGIVSGASFFLKAKVQPGIDVLLNLADFDKLCQDADLIFTGEGTIDYQTSNGKAIHGIAKRAKKYNIPLIAIVGDIGDGYEQVIDNGVTAVFSINRRALSFNDSRHMSKDNLKLTMMNVLNLIERFAVKEDH